MRDGNRVSHVCSVARAALRLRSALDYAVHGPHFWGTSKKNAEAVIKELVVACNYKQNESHEVRGP